MWSARGQIQRACAWLLAVQVGIVASFRILWWCRSLYIENLEVKTHINVWNRQWGWGRPDLKAIEREIYNWYAGYAHIITYLHTNNYKHIHIYFIIYLYAYLVPCHDIRAPLNISPRPRGFRSCGSPTSCSKEPWKMCDKRGRRGSVVAVEETSHHQLILP